MNHWTRTTGGWLHQRRREIVVKSLLAYDAKRPWFCAQDPGLGMYATAELAMQAADDFAKRHGTDPIEPLA